MIAVSDPPCYAPGMRQLVAAMTLAALTSCSGPAAPRDPAHGKERIRDRFWIWCHEAGSHNTGWGLAGTSQMTPVEGAAYLGVPNLLMIRYEGKPAPPFHQAYVPFRPFRQVVWSVVGAGGATGEAERREVLRLAAREPNLTGVIMDDFFRDPKPGESIGTLSLGQIRDLRGNLTVDGRRLDLWVVLYDHQLDLPVGPYLELCDTITFWTWKADQLKDLEANFAKAERLTPGKRRILGCYLYDYGRARPMPVEAMKAQCETGLRWLKAGRIDGMIFLASCICDLDLEAVEWTRRWIAEVGDQPLPPGR